MYGQYAAHGQKLLVQLIKSYYRKYLVPRQYSFKSIQPNNRLHYQPRYFEDTKFRKQVGFSISGAFLSFVVAVGVTDLFYSILHNEKQKMTAYIFFPVFMKDLESLNKQVDEIFKPIQEIIPKNQYQMAAFWPTLFQKIFRTRQRNQRKDQQVRQLRAEIASVDDQLGTV